NTWTILWISTKQTPNNQHKLLFLLINNQPEQKIVSLISFFKPFTSPIAYLANSNSCPQID
ncbi:MAG: hypothetical protein ACN6NT_05510, partial [Comamonas sp.]